MVTVSSAWPIFVTLVLKWGLNKPPSNFGTTWYISSTKPKVLCNGCHRYVITITLCSHLSVQRVICFLGVQQQISDRKKSSRKCGNCEACTRTEDCAQCDFCKVRHTVEFCLLSEFSLGLFLCELFINSPVQSVALKSCIQNNLCHAGQ